MTNIFLKLKMKATTTLSSLKSPNYSARLNKLANLLQRKKRYQNSSLCPYCKNSDTQELRPLGGYLKGAMGERCRMVDSLTASSFSRIYKHHEFEAHSCFACGGFWHNRKYWPNILFDSLDFLDYYFGRK